MRLHRHWPMLASILATGSAWAQQAAPPPNAQANPPAQQGTTEQLPAITVIEAPEKKAPKKTSAKKPSTATGADAQLAIIDIGRGTAGELASWRDQGAG